VTEVGDLSDAELEFYSRQIVLPEVGYNGQLKLKNAKVCIAGLGGLGSPAALQLAAMGVGHLRLVDYDVVELSNLQRQILYNVDVLGYPKVEAAVTRLSGLNPNIKLEPLPLALTEKNAEDIIGGVDVVVDGLDSMAPRYALNRACQKLGIPYVFAAAITTFGNVSTILPGKTACLECFQGNLDDDMLPKCAVVGVHPSILSIVASIEVSEAIKIILGEQPLLANRILHCDLGNLSFEKIELSKADSCPVCGSNPVETPHPLPHRTVTELCGRRGNRAFLISPARTFELDMDVLSSSLKNNGFQIETRGNLGLTFKFGFDGQASILKSGIMIIEGVTNEKQALGFYNKLLSEEIEVPLPKISRR